MEQMDTREWLLTNGLGGFASGTVADVHTRTYHGWLFAALNPPGQRTLLLSRLDAVLSVDDHAFELSTSVWKSGAIAPTGYTQLQAFDTLPVPTWVWGNESWQLTRQIVMPHAVMPHVQLALDPDDQPTRTNRVLIRYGYQGQTAGTLRLRPLIGDRLFHYQQHDHSDTQFSQVLETNRLLLQASRPHWVGTSWEICWTRGTYYPDGWWYWNQCYPQETQRGLGDTEDLYSPGHITVTLEPGETITLEARVRSPQIDQTGDRLDDTTVDQIIRLNQQHLDQQFCHVLAAPNSSKQQNQVWQQLLRAGEQFIAYRESTAGPTIMAGYHWFGDWGRDALIALPGLTLTPKRFNLAKELLTTFGHYCHDGLLPNTLPQPGVTPRYNSLDAALWWIEALGLYLEASQDWEFLNSQYPVVRRIYKQLTAGTVHGIRLDAIDGLLTWDAPGVALTWMDTVVNGHPVTPRCGKAIEVNALWYSMLCWAQQWAERLRADSDQPSKLANQASRYAQQAEQVKASMQVFWNSNRSYGYDVIEPTDYRNPTIRPNAVIALSLRHCAFSSGQGQQMLQVACDRLLTPYGLRSLDPADPRYVGVYQGNVWERDRAYHQGTVWSWLLGPFIRAWQRFYGETPLPIDWQPMIDHIQHQAGLGSVSEIFDGDAPHHPKGAIAQAWSVAELIRHWDDICRSMSRVV